MAKKVIMQYVLSINFSTNTMDTEKNNKLKDIEAVEFGDKPAEIVSTLDILLMMYEFDDDAEIISACKKRMQEGVEILKIMNLSTDNYTL